MSFFCLYFETEGGSNIYIDEKLVVLLCCLCCCVAFVVVLLVRLFWDSLRQNVDRWDHTKHSLYGILLMLTS